MTSSVVACSAARSEFIEPDPRRWRALPLLCLAGFMVILDAQVVLVALPSIEQDLAASSWGGWVLSGYLLAFGGLLLFGGRLGDLWGRRRVLIAGAVLFGTSSLACGLAWSASVLIVARVLQGVSAALMAPASLAMLIHLFGEGPERNRALACWSGVGGVGATAALLIGGPITDTLGWEWIFYLNVPVAAVLVAGAFHLLPESRDSSQATYDPAGAVTITTGLTLLTGAISSAATHGWTSALFVGLLAGTVVMLSMFVALEKRSAAPLLPLSIFRSRLFVGGNLAMLLFAMTTLGMTVTLTGYAQQVLGYSPLRFGLSMVPMTLMTLVGAWVGQAMVSRLGYRTVVAGAAALMGVALVLLSRVPVGSHYLPDLLPGMLLFGLGLGAGPVAAIAAALSAVRPEVTGVASGAANATFQIGGALGAAAVSTVTLAGSRATEPLAHAYQGGFLTALGAAVAALGGALLLRSQHQQHGETPPCPSQSATKPHR